MAWPFEGFDGGHVSRIDARGLHLIEDDLDYAWIAEVFAIELALLGHRLVAEVEMDRFDFD